MSKPVFGGPSDDRYCICISSAARKGKSLKEQRAMNKALETALNGKLYGYRTEKDANTVRELLPQELRAITYVSPYIYA